MTTDNQQAPMAGEVAEEIEWMRYFVRNQGSRVPAPIQLQTWAKMLESLSAQVEALKREADEDNDLIDLLSKLLAKTSIALKGPELPLQRHSYHDVPKVAAEIALACRIGDELLRQEREKVAAAEQRADRLQEQIEALKRERDDFKRQLAAERAHGKAQERIVNEARSNADRLQAELDAAKVDAERYQWLRDEDNWIDNMDAWQMLGELSFSDFDAFIDAARAKESGDA